MLLLKLLTPAALLASAVVAASKPDAEVVASWPAVNPFGKVTNGVSSNLLNLRLSNHAGEELVVTGVRGEFREVGGKERTLRKTNILTLRQPVSPGTKSPLIPYRFHSENKIGDVGLRVFVDFLDSGKKKHSTLAFDDVVNVVEPPTSWFDLQLLSVYAILLAVLSSASYLAYSIFVPAPPSKKSTRPSPSTPSSSKAKSTAVQATSGIIDGGLAEAEKVLDEEWIPAHHLKARKGKGTGGYASATSGDESEGARRGKGRK
ncbi:hypothetical protein JCM8097_008385 [Rhodosporidiobolus ruineniae]